MKRLFISIIVLAASVFMISCGGGTGSVNLSITDAPADASNIKNVYLTVTGIGYHEGDTEEWTDITFDTAKKYDILSLTNGTTAMLGEFTLPAGTITQLRFYLDAKVTGDSTPSNPGCYVVLTDNSEHDLFVPSGGTSGYKAVGSFDVPVNGTVSLTADFDIRKSLKYTNSNYNLQPTIRLIVDDEAGTIAGTVTYEGGNSLVVFAYEDGDYTGSEATADTSGDYFMNAVSSGTVADNGEYSLPFLAAGTYDLIFAEVDGDGAYTAVVKESADAVVASGETTTVDFTF